MGLAVDIGGRLGDLLPGLQPGSETSTTPRIYRTARGDQLPPGTTWLLALFRMLMGSWLTALPENRSRMWGNYWVSAESKTTARQEHRREEWGSPIRIDRQRALGTGTGLFQHVYLVLEGTRVCLSDLAL